jgi:ABC-type glycerol-3-phosphate transport system substrate-binding protein
MDRRRTVNALSRRDLLKGAALMAGATCLAGRSAWAAQPPGRPPVTAAKPPRLVMATLGPAGTESKVAEDALAAFTKDSGIKADILYGGDKDFLSKVLAWYAGQEQLDTVFVRENFLGSWVKEGLLVPVTGMPGLEELKSDLVESYWQSMFRDGQVWGLPYYGEFETCWAFEDKMKKARIAAPPKTWDELLEHCQKAKRDGVAKYPLLWAAGQGDHHLPWQWFQQVSTRGGTLFDKENKPALGPGSIARKTLEWWRKTFTDWGISDPRSAELRYIPAMKAFMTGDYMYLAVIFNQYLRTVNDPKQSPIAGHVQMFAMPEGGRPMSYNRILGMVSTTKSKEWTWELINYIGGKSRSGEYLGQQAFAIQVGFMPGYKSIQDNPQMRQAWEPYVDYSLFQRQWAASIHSSQIVPATYEPWYSQWLDIANVQLQDCILGKITADAACDEMARRALALKASA